MDNNYLTKSDIVLWIENWTKNNPNPTEADIAIFAKDLNNQMLKLNYKVSNGGTVIGYAGKLDDGGTGIFKTVEDLTKNSDGAYCFINNSADNILNAKEFNTALHKAVGDAYFNDIIGGAWNGNNRSKYSFGDTLSLNDLVSDNFMKNNAKGDVYLLITDNARMDSTLNVTEIERLLTMDEVKTINGIDKSVLANMSSTERFNFLKEQSVIDMMNANIYRGPNGTEILSFKGTKYEDIFKTNIPVDYTNVGSYADRAFLSHDQLFSKYTFLDLSVSQSILDEFRVGEYRLKTTGVDTLTNAKVYFDINGRAVSVRNSVSSSVFEVTVGDIRQFTPDAEMSLKYEGYDNLKLIDKIQAKKGELEFRRLDLFIDDTVVADDVLARYLLASGKKLDELSAVDNKLLKVAHKLANGDSTVAETLSKFASNFKKISNFAKKALPVVDVIFTGVDFIFTIYDVKKAYDEGDYGKAFSVLTDFTATAIGGWAITGAIGPTLIGFGAAVGGPIGAAVGAIIAGFIGYGSSSLLGDLVGKFTEDAYNDICGVFDKLNTIRGTFIKDIINGTAGHDLILADGGDDTVNGDLGNDVIYGESGNDIIHGDAGNDKLFGGNGLDTIYGNDGDDIIYGDNGDCVESDGTDAGLWAYAYT